MGLATGHDDGVVFRQASKEVGLAARVKRHFMYENGWIRSQIRPQSAGVLFGGQGRDAEHRRSVDQSSCVRNRDGTLIDGWMS